jgi:hypothetical protein
LDADIRGGGGENVNANVDPETATGKETKQLDDAKGHTVNVHVVPVGKIRELFPTTLVVPLKLPAEFNEPINEVGARVPST